MEKTRRIYINRPSADSLSLYCRENNITMRSCVEKLLFDAGITPIENAALYQRRINPPFKNKPHEYIPIAPIARIVNNRTGEVRRFLMNDQYTAFVPRQ